MSKRICRLCLAYPSVCFSLLETNLAEMLEALTSIKVNPNDVMSTITCTKCLLNMKLAFNIQQNILKSDEKLKQLALLNNVEVKLEVPDIELDQESAQDINLLKAETETTSLHDSVELLKLCCSNCVICGIVVEGSLLAKHVQEHFTDKQTCDFCNKSFNNIDEYKGHLSHKHKQCKYMNHKCNQCGVTFRYKSLYNVHMNRAHNECKDKNDFESATVFKLGIKSKKVVKLLLEPKLKEMEQGPYTCDICQKQFQFKRQFMSHSHQKKKCPICDAEITKSNLKKHIMNHSSGPQICELCGASLRSLESLRGHLAHTHSTVIYNCEECGKVFRKRYPYLLHKKKHAGEKTHICESCGKAFLTFFYLNKHIKTAHLKLRPFICEYCNKAFSSKFALRTHIRQHTNETPYKCEICGDGFRQNVSLRAHRKSKHNIIEPKTCACSVCGKQFSSDQAVISHMRLH
jgi:DNA-directed RNA polymerase subunit M/transcription elongation factor TFIIS/predicted nucleic acid-binding protein